METSGKTRTFATGAVRDGADEKPMLQLISPYFLMALGEWLRFACVDRDPPYPPRNWEKGMPFSETIGSMERHLQKIKMGSTEEDHISAIGFGAMALKHYEHEIAAGRMDPALDDMPHYEGRDKFVASSSEGRCGADNGCSECADEGVCDLTRSDCNRPFGWTTVDESLKGTLARVTPGATWEAQPDVRERSLAARQLMEYAKRILTPLAEAVSILQNTPEPTQDTVADTHNHVTEWCTGPAVPLTGPMPVARKPRVYITGPMTGLPAYNFPAFDGARDLGIAKGFDPTSPADLDREHGVDPVADPGSVERCRAADPNIMQTLVERDALVILELDPTHGDGLALLPGWENSTGAKAEIFLARWKNLYFYDACTYEDITDQVVARLDNVAMVPLDIRYYNG